MSQYLMNTALILICITLCFHILDSLKPLGMRLLSLTSSRFRYKSSVEQPPTDDFDELVQGIWDVEGFNKRIADMKNQEVDENGLYNIEDIGTISTEFTGTEIMSNDLEMAIDRRLGL